MSETLDTDQQLDALNAKLAQYQVLSRKSWPEVLAKQGGKLGFSLAQHLRGLAPAKGKVRAEALARLKAGGGLHIRPSVERAITFKYGARSRLSDRKVIFGSAGVTTIRKRGRRLNLRALMAEREISVRESGRGFVSVSARYPQTLRKVDKAKSRYGPALSEAGVTANDEGGQAKFTWDPSEGALAASATAGMSRPRARAVIALAMRDVSDDIGVYLSRKQAELQQKAGLK